ncbi:MULTISPECIES: Hcp family type VI secretion system effector [Subtercola]|uniref:Type VI secretion system tube protein Hcp n=1 Tax=Subtercola vilae TaxID=2056433 RepID=A0A4T2BPD9_9MICO|nr:MULTISPECIES: type VI secretion system tube protein Hcp [Subtercola]MEA9985034.1 type VI secretion system tube protein Hcp [Subtercola sp. RTI3]TIH31216.1 type VI secretion system tube protein Hcp [Subtercola vilae]
MALDMFINMGKTIVGESADKVQGPLGDIDVLSWGWGMSQSGTTHMGAGGGAGKASFQDLSFTKYVDSASNALMISLAKGTHVPTATLLVRKAGAAPLKYITITLTDVLVTSVTMAGSGGEDRFTENVTLNFGKVKYAYFQPGKTGAAPTEKDFSWDIVGNVAAS